VRTDTDNLARVRDPAIELLLSHTATLTDEYGRPMSEILGARLIGNRSRKEQECLSC
jgi:hypothetical protein